MSNTVVDILSDWGAYGVQALKDDVEKVSATGKTAESIRFEVKQTPTVFHLIITGRKYFSALETGRGPRKTSDDKGFKDQMLEYMRARGIGQDLEPKKREQLAKFLVYRINKEGDRTYKQGGRVVYTPTLLKFIKQLKEAVIKDFKQYYLREIVKVYKAA